MNHQSLFVFIFIFLGLFYPIRPTNERNEKPLIQMAILLDTSGSMNGLIAQAKTQIWKIVSELAQARREGKSPELQVALFEYGKDSLPSGEGYMRNIVALSTDLDKISEELFQLKTNGGSEFCGMAIRKAVRELNWSPGNEELKMIFIAGNEPFTQGTVDYKEVCKEAVSRGIIVNTIFCGAFQAGIASFWKDGADRADGRYMTIDQNQLAAVIPAPQDSELIRLNDELNKTYVSYGRTGGEGKLRQESQDKNAAASSPQVLAQRVAAKATKQYSNSSWDLLDAVNEKRVDVDDLTADELPDELKKMSKEEIKKYLESLQKKREGTQKRIGELNRQREEFLREERKKQSAENTLDTAIIRAIQEEAARKKFRFDE